MRLNRVPNWETRDRATAEFALANAGLPHRDWLARYVVIRLAQTRPHGFWRWDVPTGRT